MSLATRIRHLEARRAKSPLAVFIARLCRQGSRIPIRYDPPTDDRPDALRQSGHSERHTAACTP